MDLSPNDIRNFEFPTQMRGYSKDEVDSLLDQAADALEKSKEENLKLSKENESVKTQLNGLKQFEDTIKSAAIDARRNADNTIDEAKKESEEILNKAKAEAEQSIKDREKELARLEKQISELNVTKKSYFTKIKTLIHSHLSLIEEVNNSDIEDQLEIIESEDIKQNRNEIANSEKFDKEKSNTAQISDKSLSESSKNKLTEVIKDVMSQDDSGTQKATPVDPELAVALETYKHAHKTKSSGSLDDDSTGKVKHSDDSFSSNIIETTTRAEDIPDGFVTEDHDVVISPDTSEIKTDDSDDSSDTGQLEHNNISADPVDDKEMSGVKTETLSDELDEVVAKFEEEMDKAEKN